MPLVWHLTAEFKGYFTPQHLEELNVGWRQQGGGYDDLVIELVRRLLKRNDLTYENILGYLQTLWGRPGQQQAEQYYSLYMKMIEIVYALIYYRQVKSLPYFSRGFPPYEGLEGLAERSHPMWVFSLNHDLMAELLALHCKIPLRDGFWPDKNIVISSSRDEISARHLTADVLSEKDLNDGNLHLFSAGEPGINLIKVHGALDMFAMRDGLDICRLQPVSEGLNGPLKALEIVNEEIAYWYAGQRVRPTYEIAYADVSGEMQFLRRTLLAGAQKFNQRFPQTIPPAILKIFRTHINFVQALYVIGYSFGDAHVDLILREWLEFSGARSMVIVDPSRGQLPTHLGHLAMQIEIVQRTASDFFAQYRKTSMGRAQSFEQKLRAAVRPYVERRASKKW